MNTGSKDRKIGQNDRKIQYSLLSEGCKANDPSVQLTDYY